MADKLKTVNFKTEVSQLLELMTHSLYSHKEIFLRELISNASDACEKLRFEAIKDNKLYNENDELEIKISANKEGKTLTIEDNGIGMNYDDIINNLGTIAKSGTAEFLKTIEQTKQKDSQLIGKFGVGFYSAFMVAEQIEVYTYKAGLEKDQGVYWKSNGKGKFSVKNLELESRGTKVILHLKDKCVDEFTNPNEIKSLINKYSNHISIAIKVLSPKVTKEAEEGKEKADKKETEMEFVAANDAQAIWTKSKNKITDKEYIDFYKSLSFDFEEPLFWEHSKVEGNLEYTSLLFIPKKAPFDLWYSNQDNTRGLKLFVKRVFIMDKTTEFLPNYLRFVKGVIDSADLNLNVSREILQKDSIVTKLKKALTVRILNALNNYAKENSEKYVDFYGQFGNVLKEGVGEELVNKDKLMTLYRFKTSKIEENKETRSLDDYIADMDAKQEKIYFLLADNYQKAITNPQLDYFKTKNIEVLLLTNGLDEWFINNLHEFKGKQFQNIITETLEENKVDDKTQEEWKNLAERIEKILSERVKKIQVSQKENSYYPARLIWEKFDLSINMRKMLEMQGQKIPEPKPTLELNIKHFLVGKLKDNENNEDNLKQIANIILDQVLLAEGHQLKEPANFVRELNTLLLTEITK